MKINAALPGLGSGIFVMFVSLSSTGCAVWSTHEPMAASSLDSFQIDCSRKSEQIMFLESQRMGADDRLIRSIENITRSTDVIAKPSAYDQRQHIVSGYTNWLLNQKLLRLRNDCP